MFAYPLVGAMAVFGLYWSVKYVLLPRNERAVIIKQPRRPPRIPTTPEVTTTTPTPTTTGRCSKDGYRDINGSRYCFRAAAGPKTWEESHKACLADDANLTSAFLRREEQDLRSLLLKLQNETEYAAVGIRTRFNESHFYMFHYDDASEKRIDRYYRYRPSEIEPANVTQERVFVTKDLGLFWFSDEYKAAFICEYLAPSTLT